jgi:hypothetical protein
MRQKIRKSLLYFVIFLLILPIGLLPSNSADSANGWSTPEPVSLTDGTSYTPHLAVDSQGTLHMIWLDWVDVKPHMPFILYANKPAGSSWSPFSKIPVNQKFSDSAIAVGPDDTIHIVWSSTDYVEPDVDAPIKYISRSVNGSWSNVKVLSSNLKGNARPDVAVAPNGTVHVVWSYGNVFDKENNGIYHVMKPIEEPWTEPIYVYIDDFAENCLIETDLSSTVHLIMDGKDGEDDVVRYSYKPVDEGWSPPSEFSFTPVLESVEQLASDGQGKLYLVWSEWADPGFSLKYIKYTSSPGGNWSSEFTAFSVDDISSPAVSIDHEGNPIATWSSRYFDEQWIYSIWVTHNFAGHSLIADDLPYANASSIAVDNTGGHHVVWDSGPQPAYPGEIFYSTRKGSPQPPVTVIITPAGGTLTSGSGKVQLDFPAGAVTEDVEVTFSEATSSPTGNLAGILFFELTAKTVADGTPVTTFSQPYTLTVHYDEPIEVVEDTLSLYYWDDGSESWVEQNCELFVDLDKIIAELNHMTVFGVLGEPLPKPSFKVFLPLISK